MPRCRYPTSAPRWRRHHDDGSMDVLVALRVKVSNSTAQDQESGYRLRVTMAPDSGTYKIAKLDQVTK